MDIKIGRISSFHAKLAVNSYVNAGTYPARCAGIAALSLSAHMLSQVWRSQSKGRPVGLSPAQSHFMLEHHTLSLTQATLYGALPP